MNSPRVCNGFTAYTGFWPIDSNIFSSCNVRITGCHISGWLSYLPLVRKLLHGHHRERSKLVQQLVDSITSSMVAGECGGDPSELECFHARVTFSFPPQQCILQTCRDWTARAVFLIGFPTIGFQLFFKCNQGCSLEPAQVSHGMPKTYRTTSALW
jgi:hypothetical protein